MLQKIFTDSIWWRLLYTGIKCLNGEFQTLFRKSVKFSNFGKIFLWIDSVSKMSHTLKFWATYASRGRRFCVLMSKIFGVDEIPKKRGKFEKYFFSFESESKSTQTYLKSVQTALSVKRYSTCSIFGTWPKKTLWIDKSHTIYPSINWKSSKEFNHMSRLLIWPLRHELWPFLWILEFENRQNNRKCL